MAIVLGYEVLGKIGSAAYGWDSSCPRRNPMLYSAFGPITVAGRLLKLNQTRMANAIGYAAHMNMGIPEGGELNHFYAFVTRKATFAAQLAAAGGMPANRTSIEGEFGLFRSFFSKVPVKLEALISSLGSNWEILRAEYKPYHTSGRNTAPINLMLRLVEEHQLTVDLVTKINVTLPSQRSARKEAVFRGPFQTVLQAYPSLPYALTLALVEGEVVVERHTIEHIKDPLLNATMQKFDVGFEEGHTNARYCRIEIHTNDGRKISGETDGSSFQFPPNKWSAALQKNGVRVLEIEQLKRLEHMIGELDRLDDASKLMATVIPEPAQRYNALSNFSRYNSPQNNSEGFR